MDDESRLPPGHDCAVDDLKYESVGDWYRDHAGRVPIQMAQGLSQQMKRSGMTFAEAFEHLRRTRRVVLVGDQTAPSGGGKPRRGQRYDLRE